MKQGQTTHKIGAAILATGSELVRGEIVDTNSPFLAQELTTAGFCVQQKLTIGDEMEPLVRWIKELAANHRVLVATGGLGGTLDDLTAEAAALATGQKLIENPQAKEQLERIAQYRGIKLDYIRQKQCLMPEKAQPLANRIGIALGFYLEIAGCQCYFLPGVPKEFEIMLIEEVLVDLKVKFGVGTPDGLRRLRLFGIGESQAQKRILSLLDKEEAKAIQLGFRADSPMVELKLSPKNDALGPLFQTSLHKIEKGLAGYLFSESESLPQVLLGMLQERNCSLSLAESCTGGRIASLLTEVPGASAVLEAGCVTYSNRSKVEFLKVPFDTIQKFGAVSEEVARAMASGVLEKTGSDYSIAVTGIAGPDGGTPGKPVGTVFIAFGGPEKLFCRRLLIRYPRKIFQRFVAFSTMDLLRRLLLGLDCLAPYYFDEDSKKRFPF